MEELWFPATTRCRPRQVKYTASTLYLATTTTPLQHAPDYDQGIYINYIYFYRINYTYWIVVALLTVF